MGILVGMLSHVFSGGRNGGYDELSSPHVILFQLHGNILYGKVHILVGIRSVYVMWCFFCTRFGGYDDPCYWWWVY